LEGKKPRAGKGSLFLTTLLHLDKGEKTLKKKRKRK